MSPVYKQPRYGVPRSLSASTHGCSTCSTACVRSASPSSQPTGAYAPMPPVLGPRSPSWARLWSQAGTNTRRRSPSDSASTLTSRPVSRSSTTTRAPAWPNLPSSRHASIAARAWAASSQTVTPLPRARPSALTAQAPPSSSTKASSASRWPAPPARQRAVGMPALSISCLANSLLDSIRPAARVGPKAAMPAAAQASARPAATAASGPMTTRSTPRSRARRTMFSTSSAATSTFSAMVAVPPLPGAQMISAPRRAHAQARACSRPPEPATRMRISARPG
jgi:hypothetical protein